VVLKAKKLQGCHAANQTALSEREYVGQAEVTSAWPEGYGRMTVIDAVRVKK
jgi:hypothetical protein